MFEAYITNTALYPLMGIEVGTTVHFPTTTQELQAALAKIGIDGKRYSEVFFTSFDSDVLGLYDHLYECENIDELNELGHALLEVRDKGGLETFEAALVLGNHTRSVKDLMPVFSISRLVTPRFCRMSRFMDCLPCDALLSYWRRKNCAPFSRVRADSFTVEMAKLTVLCSISSCISITSSAESRV